MKFKDLAPGDMFEIPSPWPDISNQRMMKIISTETYMNAVYINWRRGTLDYIHDDIEVISLGNIFKGD
jgi:hypothetical protein